MQKKFFLVSLITILSIKLSAQKNFDSWKNVCGKKLNLYNRQFYMPGLAKGEMLDTLTNDNTPTFLYQYKYSMQAIKVFNYTSFRNQA
jgi:hypothetical protein